VRFCSGALQCAIARSATNNRVTPFVLYDGFHPSRKQYGARRRRESSLNFPTCGQTALRRVAATMRARHPDRQFPVAATAPAPMDPLSVIRVSTTEKVSAIFPPDDAGRGPFWAGTG
jgi:hypothetical protein